MGMSRRFYSIANIVPGMEKDGMELYETQLVDVTDRHSGSNHDIPDSEYFYKKWRVTGDQKYRLLYFDAKGRENKELRHQQIRNEMDAITWASNDHIEKYRLALYLKTSEYKTPEERMIAVEYSKELESKAQPTDADCIDGFVMVNGVCVPEHNIEEYTSEQGYYDEDDLVPPITASGYKVPKEKKRNYSNYSGAK